MPEMPCCRVGDAQHLAQLHGRDALGRRDDKVDGLRPRQQGQMRPVYRRIGVAHGDAELMAAAHAVPAPGRLEPSRVVDGAALRADRASRPTHRFKMRPASVIIREPREKGHQRHAG